MLELTSAAGAADVAAARILMLEYATSLGIDLAFQGFQAELADLPGCYGPSSGALYLARWSGEAVGCVGLRHWDGTVAEMKRLYVRPEWNGRGIGRSLADAAIAAAWRRGYSAIRLDTLPEMTRAQQLYRSLGFGTIDAYRQNPVPGTVFMELRADSGGRASGDGEALGLQGR